MFWKSPFGKATVPTIKCWKSSLIFMAHVCGGRTGKNVISRARTTVEWKLDMICSWLRLYGTLARVKLCRIILRDHFRPTNYEIVVLCCIAFYVFRRIWTDPVHRTWVHEKYSRLSAWDCCWEGFRGVENYCQDQFDLSLQYVRGVMFRTLLYRV